MKRNIDLKWFFNHPPEVIWECLTTPEILRQWSPMKDFKPEIGFECQSQQPPRKALDWDGVMYHKVLGKKLLTIVNNLVHDRNH